MVMEHGFSQYTSLPAFADITESSVCQRSPVAINRASISLRAHNSCWSAYIMQSWLPYFWSTMVLMASRRSLRTSQTAVNCTSAWLRKLRRSLVPRLPMPRPPTLTRSLGATAPSRPSAAAGTISGAASAPVPSAVLSASRLDRPFPFVAIDALLPVRHHYIGLRPELHQIRVHQAVEVKRRHEAPRRGQ